MLSTDNDVSIQLYVSAFAAGMGAVPWVVMSEVTKMQKGICTFDSTNLKHIFMCCRYSL